MNELMTPETMGFLERVVRDPSIDVNKLEQIIALQERVANQQAQRAFNLAMSRVDGEIGPVIRDRLNPGVNRKYATLEAIDAVARPVYAGNGLSVRFGCDAAPQPGWMRITCTVAHAEGYSETSHLDVPADVGQRGRTPVQGVGANITYARRYLLQMVFNIVLADDPEDDDGETQRRDRQAADAYSAREAINASVTLRAAAAPMPRGARVAEAPAGPVERTDEQWQAWLEKLRAACAVLYHRSEVVEVSARASVADASATGPDWVRREVAAILAENYGRFPEAAAEPEAEADAGAWPGPRPEDMQREREAAGA